VRGNLKNSKGITVTKQTIEITSQTIPNQNTYNIPTVVGQTISNPALPDN
jgi:hypothetical protein